MCLSVFVLQGSTKAAVTESTISRMTMTTTQTALNTCCVSASHSSFLSGIVKTVIFKAGQEVHQPPATYYLTVVFNQAILNLIKPEQRHTVSKDAWQLTGRQAVNTFKAKLQEMTN